MNRFIKKTFFILPVLILFSCENFFWPVKDSDSSGKSVKAVSTANRTIRIPGDDRDADFVMIDVNIEGGIDEIILGEDLIEAPYRTTVSSFSLARYETSYNTWYAVLQWAKSNGYTIVNEGVEGVYGGVENENNMSDPGSDPKLVEMPVLRITWRDAMVWCNALSEMCGLTPVYYTDSNFKTPIKNSTGSVFGDLNYAIEPGQVDNPYVNRNANGFRLPYVEEWEYAARKKTDGGFISGRNVSGDEAGAAIDTTATEKMNGINFPKSTKQNNYCWQRANSLYEGPRSTASGYDDTTATLKNKTGNNSIGSYRTHLSGGKLPNHLGFYDMSGNVPEWCFDYDLPYGSSYKFSTARVYRGGDHLNEIVGSRCSGYKGGNLVAGTGGFRIAQNKPM